MGKKVYVDLTHPFSAEIPRWPYFDKPEITNAHTMAKGGVLTSKITCTMHTGTHCDAPVTSWSTSLTAAAPATPTRCPLMPTPARLWC